MSTLVALSCRFCHVGIGGLDGVTCRCYRSCNRRKTCRLKVRFLVFDSMIPKNSVPNVQHRPQLRPIATNLDKRTNVKTIKWKVVLRIIQNNRKPKSVSKTNRFPQSDVKIQADSIAGNPQKTPGVLWVKSSF